MKYIIYYQGVLDPTSGNRITIKSETNTRPDILNQQDSIYFNNERYVIIQKEQRLKGVTEASLSGTELEVFYNLTKIETASFIDDISL